MKAEQIVVGRVYVAKVSYCLVRVRILEEVPAYMDQIGIRKYKRGGGYKALNLATGREIRIKSAAKLRYEFLEDTTMKGN